MFFAREHHKLKNNNSNIREEISTAYQMSLIHYLDEVDNMEESGYKPLIEK